MVAHLAAAAIAALLLAAPPKGKAKSKSKPKRATVTKPSRAPAATPPPAVEAAPAPVPVPAAAPEATPAKEAAAAPEKEPPAISAPVPLPDPGRPSEPGVAPEAARKSEPARSPEPAKAAEPERMAAPAPARAPLPVVTPRPAPAPTAVTKGLEMPGPPMLPSPSSVDVMPALELQAGGAALWRSYEFCPGLVQCGQKVFVGPEALKFVTDLPYLGGAVRLLTFPLAQGQAEPYRGLGLDARYSRGAIQVGLTDPTTQEVSWSTAWDQSWSAEVLYRRQDVIFGLHPWFGVRLGAGARTFSVSGGIEGTHSARRIGPIGGVEGGLPIWGTVLRAEFAARYALGLVPGPGEQEAFGGEVVSSDGFFGSAALAGAFGPGGLGWLVTGEYQLFLDGFRGHGSRAAGGSAREQYLSLTTSVRYRF